MKHLILLLTLAACSVESAPEPEARPNYMLEVLQHCEAFAETIESAAFLRSQVICSDETKAIEAKEKAFMRTVPKHLKAHVVYPGPKFSAHCHHNVFLRHLPGANPKVRACMLYVLDGRKIKPE